MLLRLDDDTDQPLYARIGSAVRRGLAEGEISPGDRLPAARALGEELGVNMHTVLKAYGQLRDEGLIELRRGRGAIVLATADGATERARLALHATVAELIADARRTGVRRGEVLQMIEEQW